MLAGGPPGELERKRAAKVLGPDRFQILATYLEERARGIVHTARWSDRMAALQAEWDEHHTGPCE